MPPEVNNLDHQLDYFDHQLLMTDAAPEPDVGGLCRQPAEREFFIDNLLVRIHYIIVMIRWTGLAPWEFEFPFP